MGGNTADWAASTLRTDSATVANTHDTAKPNSSMTAMAARKRPGPVCTRKPTAKPTRHMNPTTTTLRAMSATVRPTSTAERAIGSDRNRSTRPRRMSSARPIVVFMAPKTTACT
jgi:hypothetical protein